MLYEPSEHTNTYFPLLAVLPSAADFNIAKCGFDGGDVSMDWVGFLQQQLVLDCLHSDGTTPSGNNDNSVVVYTFRLYFGQDGKVCVDGKLSESVAVVRRIYLQAK